MTGDGAGQGDPAKAAARRMWALGDYPAVAADLLTSLGPVLLAECKVGPGQRVLDVGAGSGVIAIAAAEAGASVVASDLTPKLLAAGEAAAKERGVELEWIEADAEALPFGDGEFDAVLSSLGAMFAPDHQRTADELLRVCKPGGTIGMINWTPAGSAGQLFKVFATHAPPPPGTVPPVLWGTEQHVRELFGDRVDVLRASERTVRIDHFDGPEELCAYYKANFGPTIAAYRRVADDADTVAAMDRDFLDWANRHNVNGPGEPARYEFGYLLVVARKRAD
jgi:SAM-dependent methyltransferase